MQLLERYHPHGAGSVTFTFALGVFWNGKLKGVLTYGNPISNVAVHKYGIRQDESLELRKMWLANELPKNSESRALGIATMLIRKKYPRLKILITYCDSTNTATAYRGCGWIAQKAQRTLFAFKTKDEKEVTMRNANRMNLTTQLKKEAEKIYVERFKLILPLCDEIRDFVSAESIATCDRPSSRKKAPKGDLSAPLQKNSASPSTDETAGAGSSPA